jgi:hypothetical protein
MPRTFGKGSKSLTLDNAKIGRTPKLIVFTMIKDSFFLGSKYSNPFNLRHYNIMYLSFTVNGRQFPNVVLKFDMSHEKTSVMRYETLFSGSGNRLADSGLQVTHGMYIKGYHPRSRGFGRAHLAPPPRVAYK